MNALKLTTIRVERNTAQCLSLNEARQHLQKKTVVLSAN